MISNCRRTRLKMKFYISSTATSAAIVHMLPEGSQFNCDFIVYLLRTKVVLIHVTKILIDGWYKIKVFAQMCQNSCVKYMCQNKCVKTNVSTLCQVSKQSIGIFFSSWLRLHLQIVLVFQILHWFLLVRDTRRLGIFEFEVTLRGLAQDSRT